MTKRLKRLGQKKRKMRNMKNKLQKTIIVVILKENKTFEHK